MIKKTISCNFSVDLGELLIIESSQRGYFPLQPPPTSTSPRPCAAVAPRYRETMQFSRWISTNNSKTMLLRIVHPGGHVELHDRPVTAAEIMCRNPKFCVAYPYVFKQPWAIVAPDTTLMPGQKFYVVPKSTIRKLQRLSPKHSPSSAREINISSSADEIRNVQPSKEEEDDGMISICCVFRNRSKKSEIRTDARNLKLNANDKDDGLSHDSNTLGGKRTQDLTGNGSRGSPKKLWSSEQWQPSLESITEE